MAAKPWSPMRAKKSSAKVARSRSNWPGWLAEGFSLCPGWQRTGAGQRTEQSGVVVVQANILGGRQLPVWAVVAEKDHPLLRHVLGRKLTTQFNAIVSWSNSAGGSLLLAGSHWMLRVQKTLAERLFRLRHGGSWRAKGHSPAHAGCATLSTSWACRARWFQTDAPAGEPRRRFFHQLNAPPALFQHIGHFDGAFQQQAAAVKAGRRGQQVKQQIRQTLAFDKRSIICL